MKSKFYCLSIFVFCFLACSDSADTPEVANVETEVIFFNYEQDLEANAFVLEFRVKHTNKSSFPVNGFSRIEVGNKGDSFTYVFVRELSEVNCASIPKGEVCFDSYYRTGSLGDPEFYGPDGPPVVELVSATYVIEEEE